MSTPERDLQDYLVRESVSDALEEAREGWKDEADADVRRMLTEGSASDAWGELDDLVGEERLREMLIDVFLMVIAHRGCAPSDIPAEAGAWVHELQDARYEQIKSYREGD